MRSFRLLAAASLGLALGAAVALPAAAGGYGITLTASMDGQGHTLGFGTAHIVTIKVVNTGEAPVHGLTVRVTDPADPHAAPAVTCSRGAGGVLDLPIGAAATCTAQVHALSGHHALAVRATGRVPNESDPVGRTDTLPYDGLLPPPPPPVRATMDGENQALPAGTLHPVALTVSNPTQSPMDHVTVTAGTPADPADPVVCAGQAPNGQMTLPPGASIKCATRVAAEPGAHRLPVHVAASVPGLPAPLTIDDSLPYNGIMPPPPLVEDSLEPADPAAPDAPRVLDIGVTNASDSPLTAVTVTAGDPGTPADPVDCANTGTNRVDMPPRSNVHCASKVAARFAGRRIPVAVQASVPGAPPLTTAAPLMPPAPEMAPAGAAAPAQAATDPTLHVLPGTPKTVDACTSGDFKLTTEPSLGTLTPGPKGFTYTPKPGTTSGTDTFAGQCTGDAAPRTFVAVIGQTPPTAGDPSADVIHILPGSPRTLDVCPFGGFTVTEAPKLGTVTGEVSGFTYVPNAGVTTGSDTMTGHCNKATPTPVTYKFLIGGASPDPVGVTYAVACGGDGTVTFTTTNADTRPHILTFDSQGLTPNATVVQVAAGATAHTRITIATGRTRVLVTVDGGNPVPAMIPGCPAGNGATGRVGLFTHSAGTGGGFLATTTNTGIDPVEAAAAAAALLFAAALVWLALRARRTRRYQD